MTGVGVKPHDDSEEIPDIEIITKLEPSRGFYEDQLINKMSIQVKIIHFLSILRNLNSL